MVVKNLIFELIGYYKKAIIIFFLIFAFLISPYNILLKLNTTTWANVNFYERIIISLGYGFVLNAIPIVWGALIYVPCWYFLSKRSLSKKKTSDYKIELIYVVLFATAFFHLVLLSTIYITELSFLKTLFIP